MHIPAPIDPVIASELLAMDATLLGIMETTTRRVILFQLPDDSTVTVSQELLTDFPRPMGASDVRSTAVHFPSGERGEELAARFLTRFLGAE